MLSTQTLKVNTRGENELVDITERVATLVSGNGLAALFVIGSTAALTTIEYEPGLKVDFPDALERIAPRDGVYQHEETWRDDNGHSHIRASLIGPSLTVPVQDGKLLLGTWQQIVLVECDTRPREREIIVQMLSG